MFGGFGTPEGFPTAVALPANEVDATVILPLGIETDEAVFVPDAPTAAPFVGRAALGSIDHAPAVDFGHTGAVVFAVAAYAFCSTPVGFNVAH